MDKYEALAERIITTGMPASYPEGARAIADILREAFPPIPSQLIGVDTPSEDVENMIEHRTLYLQNQISALEAQLAEERKRADEMRCNWEGATETHRQIRELYETQNAELRALRGEA